HRPFLRDPLPAAAPAIVEVDDLVRFAERPVRAFLRQRLGITVGDYDDEPQDALPVELDGLAQWHVGRRMLEARLAGVDSRAAYKAEIARGSLPPEMLGKPVIDKILPTVEDIVAGAKALVGDTAAAGSVDVRVELGG